MGRSVDRAMGNETFYGDGLTWICEFTETWAVTQRDMKGHIQSH